MPNPSVTHRAKAMRKQKMQAGSIVSFTTVSHPPAGFGSGPLLIGLIELEDGSRVMGQLRVPDNAAVSIGQTVQPRMQLLRTNGQGLRIYDAVYEVTVAKPVEVEQELQEFPGYIVALYGPSGVGKSTVSKLLSSVLSEYVVKVPIMTTRRKKKGDDDEYNYITTAEFTRLHKAQKIVAATQIPSRSEKRWYGYHEKDIQAIWSQGKIPIVITERDLLQGLSECYGRRSILSFGLLPPGKSRRAMLSQLLHRLRGRGRDTEQHIQDRMKNAEMDLDFFEKNKELFDHILVNEDLDTVIEALKGHVLSTERT
jgi:guanylate kinase